MLIAFALGKQALQHDMKSHITWHVYGLLWRSVKNYDEAIRAYKMALRIEPESAQILRDLAFLQAQMRDFQGYISSRKLMLQAKPTVRQNWTALAVAHHLAGQLPQAENMLKTYEGTLKEKPAISDIENSEAVLYHNMIIEEMGETERALEHLNKIYDTSLDRTSVMEAQARLYLKLEKWDEAEKAYRALVERNNEYRLYYEELEKAMRLDRSKESDIPKLIELYESFASQNQRLDAARRIPLNFLTGSQFREAADKYLRRFLTKGVPSTFTNVKGLYEDESKRKVIFELVQGYLESAKKSSSDEKTNGDKPDRTRESSLYFLAQHYNYYITRDLPKALQYIDQVLESEPKNVVYLQTKARIYKHFGNVTKAAETMGVAREADDSDRYLNTKFAKYQLRNHENEAAITTMSRFTRNEAVGGALGDLHDMQCMWYLAEDGESYLRQGKLGLALKRFKSIYEIFDVWYEDQFDFHFFSLRKGAVRAYIDLLRWEDRLREHPFFTRAALKAVKIYTAIFDNPNLAGPQVNGDIDLDKLDPVERKKALKKAKKDQEKREKVEAERRESERRALLKTKTQKKDADAETKPADDDPNGNKLLETKTPLEDAMPYISLLLEFSPKLIVSQFAGFDVYVRKSKDLLHKLCYLY
jgi:tetratricopeptide (TPR) repeat protein